MPPLSRTRTRPRIGASLLLVLALSTIGLSATDAQSDGAAGPEAQRQVTDVVPEALECRNTFSGGNGEARFVWCFTNTGNITRFEHPQGQNHLFAAVEGYTLCVGNTVVAADNALASSGWGNPSYPGATKVFRSTSNGQFSLEQTYDNIATEKIISIQMKLTNTSNTTLSNIRLMRHADFNVNQSFFDDIWVYSSRAVTATDVNQITLKSTVAAPSPNRGVIPYSSSLPTTCTPASAPQGAVGDYMAFVTYDVGTLTRGASKTLRFIYDAQL